MRVAPITFMTATDTILAVFPEPTWRMLSWVNRAISIYFPQDEKWLGSSLQKTMTYEFYRDEYDEDSKREYRVIASASSFKLFIVGSLSVSVNGSKFNFRSIAQGHGNTLQVHDNSHRSYFPPSFRKSCPFTVSISGNLSRIRTIQRPYKWWFEARKRWHENY